MSRSRLHAQQYIDWTTVERQKARMAAARVDANRKHGKAQTEVEAVSDERAALPLPSTASDGEIAAMADRRAVLMRDRIFAIVEALTPAELLGRINAWLVELQARAFAPLHKWADRLAGVIARVQAPEWWRRQLRRVVVRAAEGEAIGAGKVHAKAGQWYASDATVRRRLRQNRRNAEVLERTELENEAGEVFTLKALADKSTGNKAIRRGELMTRIRGCEEWAEAAGHVGVFVTLTAPSRFHSTLFKTGVRNPLFDGSTPRDAQDWLCTQWASARAALARAGVEVYGFRVAEPHHDGCPHWHALLWAESPAAIAVLCMVLRRYWLQWDENEPGARVHRFKAERMRAGEACGYVAKYIAKNIDDAGAVGVEGHSDRDWGSDDLLIGGGLSDDAGHAADGRDVRRGTGMGDSAQRELFANPAVRVEAWAAAWSIRQFQAIGQPPVTVWRELRRVPADAVALDAEGNGPARIAFALDAVNRNDAERADWCGYLQVQGGTNVGRDYQLKLALRIDEVQGRYEVAERARPIGVYEAGSPENVAHSVRREWRPRGAWDGDKASALLRLSGAPGALHVRRAEAAAGREGEATQAASHEALSRAKRGPWTRVNNCTRGTFLQGLGMRIAAPLDGIRGGLMRWQT